MQTFGFHISSRGRCWTVHIEGELDAAGCAPLGAIADALRDCQLREVTFDLGAVTFADCAGYRSVLHAAKIVEEGGAEAHIEGESAALRRIRSLWELAAA
jgi:anti-anti-sigma factor